MSFMKWAMTILSLALFLAFSLFFAIQVAEAYFIDELFLPTATKSISPANSPKSLSGCQLDDELRKITDLIKKNDLINWLDRPALASDEKKQAK